ncbi:MAG: stalk domain-containing protein [Defluviitaleaceae bacterium]|nr:stalk domain-containing protein [Defluviitaleaceae bacterium]
MQKAKRSVVAYMLALVLALTPLATMPVLAYEQNDYTYVEAETEAEIEIEAEEKQEEPGEPKEESETEETKPEPENENTTEAEECTEENENTEEEPEETEEPTEEEKTEEEKEEDPTEEDPTCEACEECTDYETCEACEECTDYETCEACEECTDYETCEACKEYEEYEEAEECKDCNEYEKCEECEAYEDIDALLLQIMPLSNTVTVTDSDQLREALADDTVDVIVMNVSFFTSEPIVIPVGRTVTIAGTGTIRANIFGTREFRVLDVSGNLTLDGITITEGRSSQPGAGILVTGSTASLTMLSGNITRNQLIAGGTGTNNIGGAGVAVRAGALFTMYGGTISGNVASGGTIGGGVQVTGNGSRFFMHGGTIENNSITSATGVGGGVGVHTGRFHMYGGSIINNSATGTNPVAGGGGVRVGDGASQFIVDAEHAVIANNTAERDPNIRVGAMSVFEINNVSGRVYNNSQLMWALMVAGNTPTTIEIGADFDMAGFNIAANADITIQGNGFTLSMTTASSAAESRHFVVNGSLTIYDVTLRGGIMRGGVQIVSGGTFTMNSGYIRDVDRRGTAAQVRQGGGVLMGSNSTFIMNGGTIAYNAANLSGGVQVTGTNTVFTMNNGTIRDNTSQRVAGGIYVGTSAHFRMFGGLIENNQATEGSGGVHLEFFPVINNFIIYPAAQIRNNTSSQGYQSPPDSVMTFITMRDGADVAALFDNHQIGVRVTGSALSLSSDTATITARSGANSTRVINVTPTGTFDITSDDLPNWITLTQTTSAITIALGENVPTTAIQDSWTIQVSRVAQLAFLTIEVDLPAVGAENNYDCEYCNDTGCETCNPENGYDCDYCNDTGCETCDPANGYDCEYCNDAGCETCNPENNYDCDYCNDAGCETCNPENGYDCEYCNDAGCETCDPENNYNCNHCNDTGCEQCDQQATITVNPTTVTINDSNLSATVAVDGTATGTVTLDRGTLPAGISTAVNGANITITATRPAHGQAAISGTFPITITRNDVSATISVVVNLTPMPQQPPSGGNGGGGGGWSGGGNNAQPQPQPTPAPQPTQTIPCGTVFTVSDEQVTLQLPSNRVTTLIRDAQDGSINFNVTSVTNATTVNIPRAAVRQAGNANLDMLVQLPSGSVSFNNQAVTSIGQIARTNAITITVEALANDSFRVVAYSGDYRIENFVGSATISLPTEISNPTVWAETDGQRVEIPSQYSNNTVTFTVSNLGVFAIGQAEPVTEPPALPPVIPPATILPEPSPQPIMRLVIGQTVFTQHGSQQLSDAAPFIHEGRTMVPIRIIAETLGAEIDWNNDTRTVELTRHGATLQIVIDQPLPSDMGTAVIVENRTFVPVRYVSEMLGATIRWDGDNSAVYIY